MTESQFQQPIPEQHYRDSLRELVLAHFNLEEVQDLCYALRLDYDDLGGKGRSDNVRELIELLAGQTRIVELILVCREKRPFANWDNLLHVAKTNSDVFKPNAIRIGQGLAAMADLISLPAVREEIFHFQDDFKEAQEKIKIITVFKKIHDTMQEVECSYVMLQDDRANLEQNEFAWDSIEINLLTFDEHFDEFKEAVAEVPSRIKLGPWYNRAAKGYKVLHEALSANETTKLDTGLSYIHRVLDRGLPRVNGRLVDAANDLPFDDLIEAMTTVHKILSEQAEVDSVMIQQFVQGIEALGTLSQSLENHVTRHNDWQEFDDDLRRIEAMITEEDIEELKLSWIDIQETGDRLYANHEEKWAASLRTISKKIENSLMSKPAATVLQQFNIFRSSGNRRFRKVDDELLELCEELEKVGEPINVLLGIIK